MSPVGSPALSLLSRELSIFSDRCQSLRVLYIQHHGVHGTSKRPLAFVHTCIYFHEKPLNFAAHLVGLQLIFGHFSRPVTSTFPSWFVLVRRLVDSAGRPMLVLVPASFVQVFVVLVSLTSGRIFPM